MKEQGRLLEVLEQIENHGLSAVRARCRQIGRKLWEIKVSAHRVFYVHVRQDEMILLHAYKKQGQKLPSREKQVANNRLKEVLS